MTRAPMWFVYVWMFKSTKKFMNKIANTSIDSVPVGLPVWIDGQQ